MPTPLMYNPNVANIAATLGAGGGMNPLLPYSTALLQRRAGGEQRSAAGPRSTATADGVETASGGVSAPAYPGDPMAGTPLARVSQGGRGVVGPTTGGSPVLAEGPFAGQPFSADPANRVPSEGFASRPDFTDEQRMANYSSRMPTLMAFSYGNGIPGGGGLLGVQDSPSGVSFRPNPFDAVRAAQMAPLFARREAADKNAAELQRLREGNAAQLEAQRIQTEGNVQAARIQAEGAMRGAISGGDRLTAIQNEANRRQALRPNVPYEEHLREATAMVDSLDRARPGGNQEPTDLPPGELPPGRRDNASPPGQRAAPIPVPAPTVAPFTAPGTTPQTPTGTTPQQLQSATNSFINDLRSVVTTRHTTPAAALQSIVSRNPLGFQILEQNWPQIHGELERLYGPEAVNRALQGSGWEALPWNNPLWVTGGFEATPEQQMAAYLRNLGMRQGRQQYGAIPGADVVNPSAQRRPTMRP